MDPARPDLPPLAVLLAATRAPDLDARVDAEVAVATRPATLVMARDDQADAATARLHLHLARPTTDGEVGDDGRAVLLDLARRGLRAVGVDADVHDDTTRIVAGEVLVGVVHATADPSVDAATVDLVVAEPDGGIAAVVRHVGVEDVRDAVVEAASERFDLVRADPPPQVRP